MNFGPQAAYNGTGVFAYLHYFVLSQSTAHRLCGINASVGLKWQYIIIAAFLVCNMTQLPASVSIAVLEFATFRINIFNVATNCLCLLHCLFIYP